MGFKDTVAEDRSRIFLDMNFFGESVRIEGNPVNIVRDDDALKERQSGQELGVAEAASLFYARTDDLPERRPPGELLNINGRDCVIDEWSEDMGVATIVLHDTIPA